MGTRDVTDEILSTIEQSLGGHYGTGDGTVRQLIGEVRRLRAIVAAGVVGDDEKAHVRRMARAEAFAEAYDHCHGYFNYPELLEWLQQREVAEYDGPAERKESGDAG
jgi:hypothetical protein